MQRYLHLHFFHLDNIVFEVLNDLRLEAMEAKPMNFSKSLPIKLHLKSDRTVVEGWGICTKSVSFS